MRAAARQPVTPALDPALLRIVQAMARAQAERDFLAAQDPAPALPTTAR